MTKYSIGIDLGGTKILAGVVNKQTGEVFSFVKKKTKQDKGADAIINKINISIEELLNQASISKSEISSIGIGLPGQIDRINGILLAAPNLQCANVNIKKIIEDKFNLTTFLANDVEAATLGELKFGAGIGFKDFVCVFVGTGVGSGIVKNEQLHLGASGTAGEIGHLIVDFGGRPCTCGANGCLEAYASRSAIEKRIIGAIQKGKNSAIKDYLKEAKPIKSNMIKKALERQDELVIQTLDEAAKYLASGLASVMNFYNPELIILGGGLIDAIDEFYNLTIKYTKEKALPTPAKHIIFKKALLGDFSGIVGASLLEAIYTE